MASKKESQVDQVHFDKNNSYQELCEIGRGGYGKVYKVIDLIDEQFYAIKIVELKQFEQGSQKDSTEKILREVKILAKMNSEKVVRYNHTWIENNCLFIKMEYCQGNLRSLIVAKPFLFGREETDPLDVIEYYISCRIFEDLLKCVHYLHESKPPVIHRDLKPENILITKNQFNRNCLKIADFGLATFHQLSQMVHTSNQGTQTYMAPEVSRGDYNTKSDIYGLGRMTEELFQVFINVDKQNIRPHLVGKYNNLTKIIFSMLDRRPSKRPNCFDILHNFATFQMSEQQLKSWPQFDAMCDRLKTNVEANGHSILLDYLSELDEQRPTLPISFSNLRNTSIGAVQGSSSQNEQGDKKGGEQSDELLQQSQQMIKNMFNRNQLFSNAFSNIWEELKIPEYIRERVNKDN